MFPVGYHGRTERDPRRRCLSRNGVLIPLAISRLAYLLGGGHRRRRNRRGLLVGVDIARSAGKARRVCPAPPPWSAIAWSPWRLVATLSSQMIVHLRTQINLACPVGCGDLWHVCHGMKRQGAVEPGQTQAQRWQRGRQCWWEDSSSRAELPGPQLSARAADSGRGSRLCRS